MELYSLALLAYSQLGLNVLSQLEKEIFGRESHVFIVRSLEYIEMGAKGSWVECHQSLGSQKGSAGWTGLQKPCIKLSGFQRGSNLGSFHWVPASTLWDRLTYWKSSGYRYSQEPSPACQGISTTDSWSPPRWFFSASLPAPTTEILSSSLDSFPWKMLSLWTFWALANEDL